jgi:hypothetical protein
MALLRSGYLPEHRLEATLRRKGSHRLALSSSNRGVGLPKEVFLAQLASSPLWVEPSNASLSWLLGALGGEFED